MTDTMKRNLRRLPIFQLAAQDNVYEPIEGGEFYLIHPDTFKKVPKCFTLFLEKHGKFLHYKYPVLHQRLGVKQEDEKELIKNNIESFMINSSEGERLEIVDYLISNPNMIEQLKDILMKIAFVPTGDHSGGIHEDQYQGVNSRDSVHVAPENLYDHRVRFFKDLFRGDSVFAYPKSIYSKG
eukprot:UN30154